MRKINRIRLAIVSTVIIIGTITLGIPHTVSKAMREKDYLYLNARDTKMRKLGRTYYTSNGTYFFDHTASGVEFYFKGTRLDARLVSDSFNVKNENYQASLAVYINDSEVPYKKFNLNKIEAYYNIYTSKKPKKVKIRLVKLSEGKRGKAGIHGIRMNKKAVMAETPSKKRKIEYIGDSITCGYGNEGKANEEFKTSTENGEATYAAKAARYFDADYNIVAMSGIGVYSSVTKNDKKNTSILIPKVYKCTDLLLDQQRKEKTYAKWRFGRYIPDVIVLNIGVNDSSYVKNSTEKRDEFGKAYYKFLKEIRKDNPNAEIMCTISDSRKFMFEEIEKQVDKFMEENDDMKISAFMLPATRKKDGYGSGKHPNIITHEKMSKVLIDEITNIMNWK